MNTLERLRALSEHAVVPNEPYIVIPKNELDMLLAVVEAAEMLTHGVEQHMGGQGSDNLLYSYLPDIKKALAALE
jgi:hypothetical protein